MYSVYLFMISFITIRKFKNDVETVIEEKLYSKTHKDNNIHNKQNINKIINIEQTK